MGPIEEEAIRSTRNKQYQQYQDYIDSLDTASNPKTADVTQAGTMSGRIIKKVSAEDSLIGRLFAQHVK